MRRDRAVNVAMLVAAALAYGAIFPVNRAAAEAGWPPLAFALAQTLGGGVVLAGYVLATGRALAPTRRHLLAYLVLGAMIMALPTAVLTRAAAHVPASTLTLVLSLSPILTLLFAILARLERFRLRAVAAVALGFAGVALIAAPGSAGLASGEAGWFLVALIAPLLFAAANVAATLLRPAETTSVTMAAGILLGGAVVALPLSLAFDASLLPPAATAGAVWSVAIASIINPIVFALFFEIVRRAGPTFFSLFNYMAIAAGVVWSMIAFAEVPPPVFWLALAVMFAGVYTAVGGRGRADDLTSG